MKRITREHVIVLFVFAIVILLVLQTQAKNIFNTNPYHITTREITFPTSKDVLVEGKTYELKWTPKEGTTDLFLINKELESEGVSVSIADRKYDINNTGKLNYKVPANIPTGEYKITIGDITSEYFEIKK